MVLAPVKHAGSPPVWSVVSPVAPKRETTGAGEPTPVRTPAIVFLTALPWEHAGMSDEMKTRAHHHRMYRRVAGWGATPAFRSVVGPRVPARPPDRNGAPYNRMPDTGENKDMNSLWTPGGEHPIDPDDPASAPPEQPVGGMAPENMAPEDHQRAEELARDMAAVQEQLASMPAAVVVANHAMGLYELAAIHLSKKPANLTETAVAIDAMAGVVEKLPGRLGEAEDTLKAALHQIRMAYVKFEQAARVAEAAGPDEPDESGAEDGAGSDEG